MWGTSVGRPRILFIRVGGIAQMRRVPIGGRRMRINSTRIAVSAVGAFAGFVGAVHSYGEFLHRNSNLSGLLFAANTGKSLSHVPLSDPAWSGWIAMTFVPNFLITSILSAIMSCVIIIWSLFFMRRKRDGLVLIILSLLAILLGCGFIPPLVGIMAGVVGLRLGEGDK
jgi:hypothetical protein